MSFHSNAQNEKIEWYKYKNVTIDLVEVRRDVYIKCRFRLKPFRSSSVATKADWQIFYNFKQVFWCTNKWSQFVSSFKISGQRFCAESMLFRRRKDLILCWYIPLSCEDCSKPVSKSNITSLSKPVICFVAPETALLKSCVHLLQY